MLLGEKKSSQNEGDCNNPIHDGLLDILIAFCGRSKSISKVLYGLIARRTFLMSGRPLTRPSAPRVAPNGVYWSGRAPLA